MENREFQYEEKIAKSLDMLLTQLGENEVIKSYKEIAQKVDQHEGLKELVESIKRHQKDAVQYAHYDKPEAEKEAIRLANTKQKEFDEHPLVIVYREKLVEANDLLQYVTHLLEKNVNDGLEEKIEHKK
ncbi:YlbF family regulator [Vagococcus hydrophili]|uniref:Uncharacterized protein n=1 Tax=Vagococcus hydrophili TaxID=2714947 RepID=A0A6G8ARP3_9ENTE|nr:YlbF family regulator [Vagococcus hydrophili]QIL47734.1 hypothetical protein G7082_03865 [Vagococcus hydrophili]